METPFKNDPFAIIWQAFKNLYPNKECEVMYDQHIDDEEKEHENEYGFTHFPLDGSIPTVIIFAEHNLNIQTETLAHELAHVAVGYAEDHNEVWKEAFHNIFDEYNRLLAEIFGEAEDG